jgi:hypothetical protein
MSRWCRLSVVSLLLLAACTGEDAAFFQANESAVQPSPSDPQGAETTNGTSSGATAKAPLLAMDAQPVLLAAGTNDTLQFKVTKRQDVGETAFTVKGLPEGVSAPSVVTLGANASSLVLPLSSVATAKHGAFEVTIEAEGMSFTAPLIVRGTPGLADTGFGKGGTALVPVASTSSLKIAALADDRIAVGTTDSAKVKLFVLDAKGSNVAPPMITASEGILLMDLAPTADGGFVALVKTATNVLELVWFSKDGTELAPVVNVSGFSARPARIAATPRGTLFAQGNGTTEVVVTRYVTGAIDNEFTPATVHVDEGARVSFLGGTTKGTAWVGYQQGMQQEAISHVSADGTVASKSHLLQESCNVGTSLGDDFVARCTADGPTLTLRRFSFEAGAVKPASPISYSDGSGKVVSLLGRPDRLYVGTAPSASSLRINALDGAGDPRSVFGLDAVLTVSGDATPIMTLDSKGRIIAARPFTTGNTNVSISRYWD